MAKCNLPQVDLEPMQPALLTPIYVHGLQGDLNSLPVACLYSVTLQLIFADHLHIRLIFAAVCQKRPNFTANLHRFLLPALPPSWFMGKLV